MIAAYVRVSSKAQDSASQRHALAQGTRARHVRIDEWFEDVMTSTAAVRPELNRLRQLAREGLVSDLYVFRLDRLSRGTICEVLNLLNELEGHGCRVHSIADEFPLEGPFREAVLAMLAMCAHMERRAIIERQASARARIEAAGGKWGRPPTITAEQHARIAELVAEGVSNRKMAMALKIPRGTLSKLCAAERRRLKTPPGSTATKPP